MAQVVAAILALAGIAGMVGGQIMMGRALRRHAREGAPRALLPALGRGQASWHCPEWFRDGKGLQLYLKGGAFFQTGFTLVVAIMAFAAGRRW